MRVSLGGPPYGIPIPDEVHERLPQDVKDAWKTFHEWWEDAMSKSETGFVAEDTMPAEVKEAWGLLRKASIPGYDNATFEDSRYVQGVLMQLV